MKSILTSAQLDANFYVTLKLKDLNFERKDTTYLATNHLQTISFLNKISGLKKMVCIAFSIVERSLKLPSTTMMTTIIILRDSS